MTSSTVLFTDLVGFTEFTEACGDDRAVEVLDEQSGLVGAVLDEQRGRVVKELGDGLLVSFRTAVEGLAGALALLDAFDASHRSGSFPLSVRMGLHTGEVTERGDDIVGRTVNLASRIASLAGPGELLVSEQVADACPAAPLTPIGPTRVRGVSAPVWLHRAVR